MYMSSRLGFLAKGLVAISFVCSISAQASFYDDEMSINEAAEVLARCTEQGKKVLSHSDERLEFLASSYQEISGKTHKKTYEFQAVTIGGFAGVVRGKKLIVEVKVTAPNGADIPDQFKWHCKVESPGVEIGSGMR
jgi:hypothetical protein